jgi:hypothetical protein
LRTKSGVDDKENTVSEKLKSIMEAADRLTVDTITTVPYCATAERPLSETFAHAKREGFDWLPVRDEDGAIRRVVETRRLRHLSTWSEVKDQARKVTVDELVSGDAPMLSILARIGERPFLLCLGRNGIDRMVTVYDLNQPAARYFGLALAIIIESEIARAIEAERPEHARDDAALVRLALEVRVARGTIDHWKQQKRSSTQLPFVTWLSFGDKVKLLKRIGQSSLAMKWEAWQGRNVNAVRDDLMHALQEVLELRNDVAHDKAALSDAKVVCRRLRIAHDLAHALTTPPA